MQIFLDSLNSKNPLIIGPKLSKQNLKNIFNSSYARGWGNRRYIILDKPTNLIFCTQNALHEAWIRKKNKQTKNTLLAE